MDLENLDVLAQIAGFTARNDTQREENEILQVTNQKLITELEALRRQLAGCEDKSARLPSVADLVRLPALKQLQGESNDAFCKRKYSIYNKRAYQKKIGSPKEDNINELDSLRECLKRSEERCSRLSAEAGSHVEPQRPGETKIEFKKRQTSIHNRTNYRKRKKRMEVEKGAEEIRHTTPVARRRLHDGGSMFALEKILQKYLKSHPSTWTSLFKKCEDIRLLNISHWVNESGLIKENSLKRSATVVLPRAGERDSAKILPSLEIKRMFAIQFWDSTTREWCDLFQIKPSSLVKSGGLRPKAGYGLFAARPFKCGDRIGLYIGEIFETQQFPPSLRTAYALLFDIDKTAATRKVKQASTTKSFICDAGYAPHKSADNMKRPPVYFGVHYCNDPRWEPDGVHYQPSSGTRSNFPDYNTELAEDLSLITVRDIEEGDELYWDYTAGNGKMV
jgi:hypothetical protein